MLAQPDKRLILFECFHTTGKRYRRYMQNKCLLVAIPFIPNITQQIIVFSSGTIKRGLLDNCFKDNFQLNNINAF